MFNPRLKRSPTDVASLNRQPRTQSYVDFVIDGRSVQDLLFGEEPFELLMAFRWGPEWRYGPRLEWEKELLDQLLLELPPVLESERVILLACSECGFDIGCGAVTASITNSNGDFVWSDFGYERDFVIDSNDPLIDRRGYERLGPFRFDKQQYREALLNPPPRLN
jgi:hypothetical protein